MSNRLGLWMGAGVPKQQSTLDDRAGDTARIISAKPSVIVIERSYNAGGEIKTIKLSPQTVRVEVFHSAHERENEIVKISFRYAIVVGYKGHPFIPDTDMKRADRFFLDYAQYEVIDIVPEISYRLLATADVTS